MRLWGGEVFLFPNFLILPQFGNALSYRIRPHNLARNLNPNQTDPAGSNALSWAVRPGQRRPTTVLTSHGGALGFTAESPEAAEPQVRAA